MDAIRLTINGIEVQAPPKSTILEAAHIAGIRIPTLCWLKGVNEIGSCRVCVVEVTGIKGFVAACVHPAKDGIEVFTNTPALRKSRKTTLELILSDHRRDCLSCRRNLSCELQALAIEYKVDQHAFSETEDFSERVEEAAAHLVRDNSRCIVCRRCASMCFYVQHVGVIGTNDRGFDANIGVAFDVPLDLTSCVCCGQCVAVCPTGALIERDDTQKVWNALADDSKHVIIAPAPSVRAQLGECFGMPIGSNVTGKLATALRRLGFYRVFDVDTAADMTVMEEAAEFIRRLEAGGPFPMMTSCSPGWVKFCEHYYPDMIKNLSTCKSPQQMYGALMKTYYAEKEGLDPENLFVVSVMPCTAKKFEIARKYQNASGYPDVDISLTTRELAAMIKQSGMIFEDLPDSDFDPAFGVASGAAHIFGVTGGVMEAALRTVAETVTGQPLESVDFKEVRGAEQDIKEAEYVLNGKTVKVAVTSGLSNANKLIRMVRRGEKDLHFIEIMACPGGCVNGGGAPFQPGHVHSFIDLKSIRAKALYSQDEGMQLRKSHENPVVKEIYDSYLGHPGSEKAHEILHTRYVARDCF